MYKFEISNQDHPQGYYHVITFDVETLSELKDAWEWVNLHYKRIPETQSFNIIQLYKYNPLKFVPSGKHEKFALNSSTAILIVSNDPDDMCPIEAIDKWIEKH